LSFRIILWLQLGFEQRLRANKQSDAKAGVEGRCLVLIFSSGSSHCLMIVIRMDAEDVTSSIL
jgi:hypothetical protein